MTRRDLLATGVAALMVFLQALGAFVTADERLADWLLRRRGEVEKVPRSVAVVGVTDSCLTELGPWPWKPELYVAMVQQLTGAGVASILWDLPLPAPGDAAAAPLGAAFTAAGNVLVSVVATGTAVEDGAGRLVAQAVVEPALGAFAAGLGHVQVTADADGLVRRVVPVLRGPARDYPALPLLALARRVMAPGETPPVTPDGLVSKLDAVPDRAGRLRLKFYGRTAFETLPFAEVLAGAIPRSAFEGRVALVGSATLGLHAQYPTPFGRMDRVQILTTAVANGLEGQFLTELPSWAAALVLVIVALLGGRLAAGFGAFGGLALGTVALAAYAALAWWAFGERARLLPLTGVACAMVASVLAPAATALGFKLARRLRARPWAAMTGFTREGPLVELARDTLGAGYSGLSLLGAGGMGFVVKAVRASDQRPVAVKLLAPQLADQPAERARFEREVQLMAALPHPGIVRLLSWELAGLPHYTMELVVGVSLAERLRGGPLPLGEVARAVVPLAETLAYAHAHHCVHRDVKPANVLIDDQGAVKLIDFGAACRFDSVLADEEASTAGTSDYMAPEAGAPGADSPRLDVWGLGVLVYELLSGRLPWPRGAPPAGRTADSIEPITSAVPGLPVAVSQAVMAALAVDPAARPDSPAALAAALAPHRKD